MKKLALASAVTGAALMITQPASAAGFFEEVTWVPQIGVQLKQLEFDQEFTFDGTTREGDLEADIPSLALSLTAVYKKGYITLKYEDSLDDVHADSDVPFTDASTEVVRTDYSFTVGYNVWDSVNLFGGYMEGETTFTPEARCIPVSEPLEFCDVLNEGNIAQRQLYFGLGDYEQKYTEDGWFLGASYAWKVKDIGTLSFSLAYADLDSEYKDNFFPEQDGDFKLTGDADGLSFGVTWSQPLTKRMGYYLDLRTHQYDAKTDDDNGNFPGANAKSEETITAFTAGMQWYL